MVEPLLQGLEWGHVDGQVVHRLAHVHGGAPDFGGCREGGEGTHGDGSRGVNFFLFGFVAQAEQEIGDGDIDGADFVAGSAER